MNEAFLQGSMYLYNIYNGIKLGTLGPKCILIRNIDPKGWFILCAASAGSDNRLVAHSPCARLLPA